jgi:aspartyl-tRNA(Asn)/glutamyl-tRNA(Gln) amidotransferase subunit C
MAGITRDEVARLAALARLRLEEGEITTLSGQLETILSYVEQLGEVDVEAVEPTSHVLPLATPLREDRPRPSLDPQRAVAEAPAAAGTAFAVPHVLEGEDEG